MSNVHRLPDRGDSTTEACGWLARIERGLTEREHSSLREWLAANPTHAPALIEVAKVWDNMDTLSRLSDLFPTVCRRPRRYRQLLVALPAAMLLAIALVFAIRGPQTQIEPRAQVLSSGFRQLFETAVGEHLTIRLPDGSELTLNTNSRVLAEFSEDRRKLKLERGEVFVHVAHDEGRPLTVWAGDKVVRAVGTAFNVEITDQQRVEVIVTEGKVLIEVVKADAAIADNVPTERLATPVAAGQRILMSHEQSEVHDLQADEINVRLSWRAGNIVFHGEPLAEALGEIERYTRVTFVIRDEELKAIRVAGLFKAGDVDGLLETLRQNFNISYERVGAEKIVLKSE